MHCVVLACWLPPRSGSLFSSARSTSQHFPQSDWCLLEQLRAAWPRPARWCGCPGQLWQLRTITAISGHQGEQHLTQTLLYSQPVTPSSYLYSEMGDGLGYQSLNVFAKLWRKVQNYNCNPSLAWPDGPLWLQGWGWTRSGPDLKIYI